MVVFIFDHDWAWWVFFCDCACFAARVPLGTLPINVAGMHIISHITISLILKQTISSPWQWVIYVVQVLFKFDLAWLSPLLLLRFRHCHDDWLQLHFCCLLINNLRSSSNCLQQENFVCKVKKLILVTLIFVDRIT